MSCCSPRTWLIHRVFVDREGAAICSHPAALNLFHVEGVPAGNPSQRLLEDALCQVATWLLAVATPADRTLLNDIDELAFALLNMGRLVAKPIEGLGSRIERNLHLHGHGHQLE